MTQSSSTDSLLLRLNKAIAQAGVCSRRKADELIKRGQVKVNDRKILELGTKINPDYDQVKVNNSPIHLAQRSDQKNFIYLALYKPIRVISSVQDPQGRSTVINFIPQKLRKERLIPIGRLDFMSEGLLLMTNDGELTNRLTHPRWHVAKTYQAFIRGKLRQNKIDRIQKGMKLQEGEQLSPVKVKVLKKDNQTDFWLRMTLYQGLNRQIRRMCRDLNWDILKLIRTSQGPIHLDRLSPGKYRHLNAKEVQRLRQLTELRSS